MKATSVIYMGTPEFAVEPLKALLDQGINVKAVVTAPDRPAGRGKKMKASAVKEFALLHNLPLLQPLKLKDPDFINDLTTFDADLFIVIAFRMLPSIVWKIPRIGTFNIHGSLLPEYRGAAPINWAVINGEKETGLTSFMINEEIDAGSIILKKKRIIKNDDTAGSLHDKLMKDAAELVIETIGILSSGSYELKKQILSGHEKPAPKIFKEDCKINWQWDVNSIYNFIRGLSPYPTAWTPIYEGSKELGNIKIFKSDFSLDTTEHEDGEIYKEGKSLNVSCKNGTIIIHELQWPGKKRMDSASFLNGFRLPERLFIKPKS